MITITTNDIINSKKAEIDKHVYTVRKMGAGDQLDLSQYITQLNKVQEEIKNLEGKKKSGLDVNKEQQKFVEKFNSIYNGIIDCYARLFDDGEDGKKSRELVKKVGIENIGNILNQIFGE